MDRKKREEVNKRFADRRAQLTTHMSQLGNLPDLQVARQLALAKEGETLSLTDMLEEQKEKRQ